MQLQFIDLSSKLRTLDVQPSMTIKDIQRRFYVTEIRFNASIDYELWEKSVDLYLNDEQLEPNKHLSDYSINEESTEVYMGWLYESICYYYQELEED